MASIERTDVCPVCAAPSAPLGDNRTFPFCSERCRTIDLGRWLDERYRIATPDESPVDDADDTD